MSSVAGDASGTGNLSIRRKMLAMDTIGIVWVEVMSMCWIRPRLLDVSGWEGPVALALVLVFILPALGRTCSPRYGLYHRTCSPTLHGVMDCQATPV